MTANLPSFIVIGAPKSGTTSIFRYLKRHPEIYVSPIKEPRYFAFAESPPRFTGPGADELNAQIVWREEDYRALFAARGPQHKAAGEASATYLWAPGTAERIARAIPAARLVAILRQPADRAYSHFLQNRHRGLDPLASFEEALAAEPGRKRDGCSFNLLYVERGFYAAQLTEYLRWFSREQLLVVLYDDLVRNPTGLMRSIASHVGVTPEFAFDSSVRHNERALSPRHPLAHRILTSPRVGRSRAKAILPRSLRRRVASVATAQTDPREDFDPAVRARLTAGFEADIRELEILIDRDLSEWLRP